MSLENRLHTEIKLRHNPTEVLDHLESFDDFFEKVIVGEHDTEKLNQIFVIGPAGVGKSTISSQVLSKIFDSEPLQRIAENAGKHQSFGYYPFDLSLRELLENKAIDVPLEEGEKYTTEHFELASRNMAHRIAGTKIGVVAHNEDDVTLVSDFVGLTEQRGGLVIKTQFDSASSLIVVLPDREGELLRRSKELRIALHTGRDAFIDKLREFKVKIDKPITKKQYEKMKKMMGNQSSVDRVNAQLAQIVDSLKPELMKRQYEDLPKRCPDFTYDSFLRYPEIMADVLDFYARYLVLERWKIPGNKVLFTHNQPLDTEINYYVSQLESLMEVFR